MTNQSGKLEEGLLQAMKAVDNQIARAMQRTPAERELHGVQKWEPYETRVEHISVFLLNALGDQSIELDSLLVFAQAFAKTLRLVSDDLGVEGLGNLRASYCIDAARKIEEDVRRMARELAAEDPM